MLFGTSIAMLLSAAVSAGIGLTAGDLGTEDRTASAAMIASASVAALCAALTWSWGRGAPTRPLGRRDAAVAVTIIWFGISALGALPFVIGAGLSPADAWFETTSGFSTTGATVVADIEGTLARPLLLWRSLTQWLGGMGVVVLFVAVFPGLGFGHHMFRSEVASVVEDRLQPRIAETSLALWRLYAALTAAAAAAYWLCGLDAWESLNHALATTSTGGFSTRNASLAAFDNAALEYVASGFMLASGASFALYYGALRSRSLRAVGRNAELRAYLAVFAISVSVFTVSFADTSDGGWSEALRRATFVVATTITSTGFTTSDSATYPPPALALLLALMFSGGCSGSTSGGTKIGRLVILGEATLAQLRRSVRPQVIHVVRVDGRAIDEGLQLEVGAFLFAFCVVLFAGTLVVSFTDGVPVPTAFGAMLTCLSNMGPAPFYEGADNFVRYSAVAKSVFGVAMLLGRLELFTVLAVLLPQTWKR